VLAMEQVRFVQHRDCRLGNSCANARPATHGMWCLQCSDNDRRYQPSAG
jgi:hypothetical protein